MVTITSLVLAIVLSAAFVWVVSAIVWMVLPWHKKEFSEVSDEAASRDALKGLAPGQYNIPYCTGPQDMKEEGMQAKFNEGPVAFVTVLPNGLPNMGKQMGLSFAFYLVVGVLVAYVASRTLPAGAGYLSVFQVTGTVAWLAHSFAVVPDAIWFGRPLSNVGKAFLDGLIYALVTGGTFGWLWPAVAIG